MRLVSLSSRRFSVAFFLSTHCGFRSLSCSSSLTRGRKAFTRSISGETASCSSNTMDDVGGKVEERKYPGDFREQIGDEKTNLEGDED